jgi:membrane protein implicated in regulation of membrane protease activity
MRARNYLSLIKRILVEAFALLLSVIGAFAVGGVLLGGMAGDLAPVFFFISLPLFYWLLRAWLHDMATDGSLAEPCEEDGLETR